MKIIKRPPVSTPYKKGYVSLERALSKLGLASRTQARAMIQQGRVKCNSCVIRDPRYAVRPEAIKIMIDQLETAAFQRRVIALHKPRGLVTTRADEKGRATIYKCLEGIADHLIPIGRLDRSTSGLLLLTNSTRLADWITDPRSRVKKTYVATVRGEVLPEVIERIRQGIRDNGELLSVESIRLMKSSRKESRLEVVLSEGKNREIKRIFKSVGHEVTGLIRISVGGVCLGDLPYGVWREVSAKELDFAFQQDEGLKFSK